MPEEMVREDIRSGRLVKLKLAHMISGQYSPHDPSHRQRAGARGPLADAVFSRSSAGWQSGRTGEGFHGRNVTPR
jgi:hypothetical protein